MGIQGQGSLLFKSKEIEFNNIIYLIEHRHAERERSGLTSRLRPKVTIDASLIGYKYLGTSLHPSNGVHIICTALANRNIDVLIVCDPPTRHHSKRAYYQRVGKNEMERLKIMLCRMELSCAGNDSEKIRQISDDIRKLEKGESRTSLPANFVERLQELVSTYDSGGKGVMSVEIAPFQADPSIADIALSGGCDAILSGDSDFAMYVGPGGPDKFGDIMIRDVKINQKQSTVTSCSLVTGQEAVASKIEDILISKGLSNVFQTRPKYPLFNEVEDPKMRALMALALGCDALPWGVPGVGASSLHNLLQACNWNDSQDLHLEFATKLASLKKSVVRDPNALLCLANSLVYEKTTSEIGYMHHAPNTIEKYNEAFAAVETQVFDGPPMVICKGCNGHEHAFLEAEGVSSCATCKASLCRFCTWEDTIDNQSRMRCFECTRYNIAGEDGKTEQEMRLYLRDNAVNINASATYTTVLKLFRHFENDEHAIFRDDIRSVKYPLLPTSTLNTVHDSSINIERLTTISVRRIGTLIRSFDIDIATMLGLVHLLGSLTHIRPRMAHEKLCSTHAVPMNLVNMARNARVHTSQRLIDRGLRHATDRASPDILDGQITLGRCHDNECKGEVCIILENNVRASMKNVEYETKSAITCNHFLATECNCRAGCSNKPAPTVDLADVGSGKVICSHGMTLPIALSLALFRGLAAHCLSELRLRILREDSIESIGHSALSILRQDISSLMKAAGRTETAMDTSIPVAKCLEMFSVGTDLPKKAPSSPKAHDLGLLREKCCYNRSSKIAEDIVLLKEEPVKSNNLSIDLSTRMTPTLNEEYLSGQLAVDALSLVFAQSELASFTDDNDTDDAEVTRPIGLELLRERASHNLSKLEYNNRNSATKEAERKWNIALLQWTNERARSYDKKKNQFEPPPPVVSDSESRKRKADGMESEGVGFAHKYCCVDGCSGNSKNATLKRITDYPVEIEKDASRKQKQTHAKKHFIRRERTQLLGFGRDCFFKDLRACVEHWKPVTGKRASYKIDKGNGTEVTETFLIPTFHAPVRVGGKRHFESPPEFESKGNAIDQSTLRHVLELSQDDLALSQQQFIEMQDVKDGKQELGHINPSILSTAGLDVHKQTESDHIAETKVGVGSQCTVDDSWRIPTIPLKALSPKEVKRRTGFHDLKMLLSFVSVACGGDFDSITKTTSILTWLEEWILCFEFVWGRTIIRFTDNATTYCCRGKTIRRVIIQKLRMIIATRDRWPMYASFAEDAKYRDRTWNGHFDPITGERVVMHDSTNIPLAQPSSAALQRALYNSYYGMCCAKAGVAVQLCGYIYGLPLNTGHSDDTRFIEDTDILKKQQIFAENDESSKKPFLNVFDKGYQCVSDALECGQYCLQPTFAESEKQFKDNAVLYSGAVAVVRSGNERAVNRCKMSWFLKRGATDQMWDIDLLCDVWDAWTFQINFMYEKFL
jgi:hypothetical protein